MRKLFKTAALAGLIIAGAMAAPAFAQHWGHWGGRGVYVAPRVGVYIGAPIYSPWAYSPYYGYPTYGYAPYYGYAPAPYVAPSAPATYAERDDMQAARPQTAQAGALPSGFWYYCADTKAYYPHVRECASPWQPVSPQPPGPQQPPAVNK